MSTPLPPPAERFARLIDVLCGVIAAHGPAGGLGWPLIGLLWSRLRRMADRFARLAGRPHAAAPRAAPGRRAARRTARPPPPRLPRGFAWLVRLVPQAAASASQLQDLLADPAMSALIAAVPQSARILRPLCRMLGVHPPAALRPPPRAAAPARPPRIAPRRQGPAGTPPTGPPSRVPPIAA